eukprot:gnl/TRDRNA2_/TRDRNA2_157408_c4_seq6.p1 gnl/TRDRNA2_/TRDRNA2_157408_c4~~gnl/TRDRNA2_/TRDRNA2_157408_c4_seq6.p1  ORF type:complete len:408 (-),score=72.39 gnl/TRDRNA2_/TRDRNA2_157408_c4_seq6:54-1196(-)
MGAAHMQTSTMGPSFGPAVLPIPGYVMVPTDGMMPPPGMMPGADLAMLGDNHGGPPEAKAPEAEEPKKPPKKRKLKGLDASALAKLISGIHQTLRRLAEAPSSDKPNGVGEAPVSALESEFAKYWGLNFDVQAMGEPSTASFLSRFPEVFRLRSNGVQMMVAPIDAPNFEQAAESGMDRAVEVRDSGLSTEYAVSFGEQIMALLVNLVAEERKLGGAPLNYQFANYAIVQECSAGLRDGQSKEDLSKLIGDLMDPKPHIPEPPRPNRDRDEHDNRDGDRMRDRDRSRDRSRDRGRGRSRDRDFHRRPGSPPPDFRGGGDFRGRGDFGGGNFRSDDFRGGGGRRGGPGPDRRGNDGRSLCRQFQNGRCTYGDTCKFAHERP